MKKKRYNLTFAQAFLAMLRGCVVANSAVSGDRFKERGVNFQMRSIGYRGWRPMILVEEEVRAKWRIVPTKGHPNV